MKLKTIVKPIPEINMIPMIDVIMMLLIFFLVATQMKREETDIDVMLPESAQASLSALKDWIDKGEPTPLTVNILAKSAGGQSYVVQRVRMGNVELTELMHTQALQWVKKGGEQASVRIRCDKGAEFSQLTDALRACQRGGIKQVFIAAQRGRQ